jgi:hypothetical protein
MWWLAALGCGPEGGDDPLSASETPQEDVVLSYENTGVACLRNTGAPEAELLVDFGDCLSCSQDQLSCEAELEGDRIVVNAGGLVVVSDCTEDSTCANVSVRCATPALADGPWTLVYAGLEVAVEVPASDWICTGPTGML